MMYPDELNESLHKKKQVTDMRTILEKEHGREVTSEEVDSALRSINTLAGVFYQLYAEESKREELLKSNPKGYHLKDGGICIICGSFSEGEKTWYDKHGLKCIYCQKAITKKYYQVQL